MVIFRDIIHKFINVLGIGSLKIYLGFQFFKIVIRYKLHFIFIGR